MVRHKYILNIDGGLKLFNSFKDDTPRACLLQVIIQIILKGRRSFKEVEQEIRQYSTVLLPERIIGFKIGTKTIWLRTDTTYLAPYKVANLV